MTSMLPTADQLEEVIHVALSRGDMEGVSAALHVLAVVDVRRCERVIEVMRLALEVREDMAAKGLL